MPNFQVISRDRHSKQYWQRYSNYAFAANEAIVPMTISELPKAVMSLPLGLFEQGDGFVPVAILGLQSGRNFFVAPDGRWTLAYVPAAFRAYPFRLGKTEDGQLVLCVDEDSSGVSDGEKAESFFAENGQPTQIVLDTFNFLTRIEQSWPATVAACAVLKQYNLICPWPIVLTTDAGEQQISGFFQIDEAALNALSAEALFEVRQSGALQLAYCQLLSMQHLAVLGPFYEAHAKADAKKYALNVDANLAFLGNGETFSFGGLG